MSANFDVDIFRLGYFISLARIRRCDWLDSELFPRLYSSADMPLPLNNTLLMRSGKWSTEEEKYSEKLITEFKLGNLPIRQGTSLRVFLSGALSCTPMRISKKFVHENKLGKQVYQTQMQIIDFSNPTTKDIYQQLVSLEYRFLERIASDYEQLESYDDSGGVCKHLLDAVAEAGFPEERKRRRCDKDDLLRRLSFASIVPVRSAAGGEFSRISSRSINELNKLMDAEVLSGVDSNDDPVGLSIC